MQTVRLTSILPALPSIIALVSAALAFCNKFNCEAARPAPTPIPERRKKVRRSIVGTAAFKPRAKLPIKWLDVLELLPEEDVLRTRLMCYSRENSYRLIV